MLQRVARKVCAADDDRWRSAVQIMLADKGFDDLRHVVACRIARVKVFVAEVMTAANHDQVNAYDFACDSAGDDIGITRRSAGDELLFTHLAQSADLVTINRSLLVILALGRR